MNLTNMDTTTFLKTINDASFTKQDYDKLKIKIEETIQKYNNDMKKIGEQLTSLNNEREILIASLNKIYTQSGILESHCGNNENTTEISNNAANAEIINNENKKNDELIASPKNLTDNDTIPKKTKEPKTKTQKKTKKNEDKIELKSEDKIELKSEDKIELKSEDKIELKSEEILEIKSKEIPPKEKKPKNTKKILLEK